MAGLIDTSLIRPELAGSFAAGYRGAEQARQQSAQAAQQLVRGRQQMQMDEMKMRQLQEDRAALIDLRSRLRAAGQSDDPRAFFRVLKESDNPSLIEKGFEGERRYEALMAYDQEFGPGATTPASAPGAITAPAAAPEGELVAAPITPPMGTMREIAPNGAASAEMPLTRGANALAPTAAAPANAMTAAQPAAPAQDVNALMRRYNLASRAGLPDAPLILKQVEAALKGNTLSDRYVPVGNLVFDRVDRVYISPTEAQLAMMRAQQQPAALVPILQNGRPVLVPREQAVGQTPFSPASVQVLGMGPGREPPAPTVTQIQDPTNPSQMITIDARRYQGGGVGSPGVIGTSGKTPAVAAAAQKREEGATQAQDILDTLRTAYEELDRAKAVPSQQRNALSNALSYVAGTGVGQVAGRVVGTEAQTQRDIIQSARNQMLNAIKNATGMSAQQLNSNVEFRSWLEALTDPTRSIEANRAILSNMEKFIASGGKYSAKPGSAAPAAPPAGGATGGWSVVR